MNLIIGILIPFLGTALGASLVFFMKKEILPAVEKTLLGFAAGIMTAASVWSLLLPAIDHSSGFGKLAFLPAALGFSVGILFLLAMDRMLNHVLENTGKGQEFKEKLADRRNCLLLLSVTLHNIPEGLAVGVAFAGVCSAIGQSGNGSITLAEALALAVGIAIQNIPEGTIISMPFKSAGMKKGKAFLLGALSGAVEPLAAVLTLGLASMVESVLPCLLAFAAGAMVLVVVEELIPEAEKGKKTPGTLGFAAGFLVMMILDVALG